jgi:predicted transposase YbfD/YdcC
MYFKYIVLSEKSAYSKVFSVKPEPITTLWFMLHEIIDPRRPQGRRHDLPTLLTLAILSICCGQESYLAMHEWSVNYQEMLSIHVPFLSGHTPDAATFHRVFARLDGSKFEEIVGQWLQSVIPTEKGEGIALDGKSLHGTVFHLVASFSHIAKGVLFEMSTETKGKELVVGPKVLTHLSIKDRVVTGDALFAQRMLCEQIVKRHGGYVIRVKGNQENMESDIRLFFKDIPFGKKLHTSKTTDHWKGQKEIREISVSSDLQLLSYLNWPGLTDVWQQTKTVTKDGYTKKEIVVGIACIPEEIRQEDKIAQQIQDYIRGHWGIENRLHRQRDMVFHEDHSTIRKGNGPQIMAATKNIVLSVFHRATVRNFKTAQRRFASHPEELFAFLGLTQIQKAYTYA